MRIAGFFSPKKTPRISKDDSLDNNAQKRLHRFQERLAKIIVSSNHEIISKALPVLGGDFFVRLSVKTSNARVSYMSQIMRVAEMDGNVPASEIEELQKRRLAFEELGHAFSHMERLIERGYAQFVD